MLLVGESNGFFSYFETLLSQPFCRMAANGVSAFTFIKHFQPTVIVIDSLISSPDPWQFGFMLKEQSVSFQQKYLFAAKSTSQLQIKAKWMSYDACLDGDTQLKQFKAKLKHVNSE